MNKQAESAPDVLQPTSSPHLDHLLPALQRLDRLLERAVAVAGALYGPESAADPFRGLHISQSEVEKLLARVPGSPLLWTGLPAAREPAGRAGQNSPLDWLAQTYGLSAFELDALLIGLAPEFDLRYERLYAFLQNDVTRRRPSVDLVLNLLCGTAQEKLARRVHFAPDAALIRHGLAQLIADPQQAQSPFLAHHLKVDDQIVRLLLGQEGIDSRLSGYSERLEPASLLEDLPLDQAAKGALRAMAEEYRATHRPLRLYLQSAFRADARDVAEALAEAVGSPLLTIDLGRALASDPQFEQVPRLIFREAWFQGAVLQLEDVDALRSDDRQSQCRRIMNSLSKNPGITVLSGTQRWQPMGDVPVGVLDIALPLPEYGSRRSYWEASLAAQGIALEEADLHSLSGRFRLAPSQIVRAVLTARERARWREAGVALTDDASSIEPPVTLPDLFSAARAQSGHQLAALTRKIEPTYTWADIVLPAAVVDQLREICHRAGYRHQVMDEWGFGRKLALGKGVNVLFAGGSGTGKTMAAEVVANELGLDLYKIDLSTVVSKYIGETEKNLDRIFTAAEDANGILFFDEADALFGKRSEVRDSHDRYANVEISYLLQKMEQYEGISVLATNLRQNLDEGFVRRLAFTVHFPFPDETDRLRIWEGIWPADTPLDPELDLGFFAERFKLSGGNIKNIALASAFLAAGGGGVVTMEHLRHATQREYQKLGKILSPTELYGASNGAPGQDARDHERLREVAT